MLNSVEQRFTMLLVIGIWIHLTHNEIWIMFLGLGGALVWAAWIHPKIGKPHDHLDY